MSMNLFFVACTQKEIDDMRENHGLIDKLVDSEGYAFSTDIETAWDVLRIVLDGVGIEAGEAVDDALFNGCSLISSDEVKTQALALAKWSEEKLLEGLKGIADSNAYHLEVFQADEPYFLEQFEKMAAFYKAAADKGLAAISYAA